MEGIEKNQEVYPQCHWCAENVGWIALWGNIGMFVLKLFCGIVGNSKALIADAVHSFIDILTATVVLISLRVSQTPPDKKHPYGHGQVEYITTLLIGISLIIVMLFICYDSLMDIVHGVTQQPKLIALLALVVSIVANELMFRQSYCCGSRFGSPAMIANAWENRADVYTSLGALVGVVGAQLGFLFMDQVGAMLVAILIARTGIEMLRNAWYGILDRTLEETIENRIRKEANADPGVREVASLQTRAIGQNLAVDLKLGVSPNLTLREASEITERVKGALLKKIENVGLIDVSPTGRKND